MLRRAVVKAMIISGGTPRCRVSFSSWPIGSSSFLRCRPCSARKTRTARRSSRSPFRTTHDAQAHVILGNQTGSLHLWEGDGQLFIPLNLVSALDDGGVFH